MADQSHLRRVRGHRRGTRGQSLAEFAISSVIFILLLSGVVDLGRAFFTLVSLRSAISEGAHWAAAYPDCIPTATDTVAGPDNCQGTNSIVGRILNETTNLSPQRFSNISVAASDVTTWLNWSNGIPSRGQTVYFKASYTVDTIMPLTRLLFGSSVTVSAEAKEVVRGSGTPDYKGTETNQGNVSYVNTPSGPGGINQQATGTATCSNGVATITWNPVMLASGYRLYAPDGITLVAQITPASNTTTTINVGFGNTVTYFLTSYTNNGIHEAESSPSAVTVNCGSIQPTNLTATCLTGGAQFSWTPVTTDTVVAGYALIRTWPYPAIVRTYFTTSGAGTNTGTFPFTQWSDNPGQYKIQAITADNALIGQISNGVSFWCPSPIQAPQAVTNFKWAPTTCNNGVATISWTQSTDALGYTIYLPSGATIDVPSNFITSQAITVGSGNSISGISIKAYTSTIMGRLYGSSTSVTPGTISCPALIAPTLTATCNNWGTNGYTSATFSWTPFTGDSAPTGYILYRQDNVARSSTLPITTGSTLLNFGTGDNPASYLLRMVNGTGSPIGTASPLKSVNCPAPTPIQSFSYVPNSCVSASASNRQYTWQWANYSLPVSIQFVITDATTGEQWTPSNVTVGSTTTTGTITIPKQREGDFFTISAIYTVTGAFMPLTTSSQASLPYLGNQCP